MKKDEIGGADAVMQSFWLFEVAKQETEMKNCDVFFQQMNKRITVPAGTLLSEACIDAGIFLDLVCGGEGICGKCRILIRQEDRMESVLACRTSVNNSITVILPEEALKQPEIPILENGDEMRRLSATLFNPAVQKMYVDKASLAISTEITFVNQIRQYVTGNQKLMSGEDLTISYPAMKQLDFHLHNPAVDGFTLVTDRGQVIDIQAGDTTSHLYGAAVDIGTTTLVLYLYDMCTGRLLGVYSDRNPQVSGERMSSVELCTAPLMKREQMSFSTRLSVQLMT
jgi:uncharacterized 2Fe-2S/4Fe-4S cluster protein (DUF4445 family)